ncbi:hypothetical protein [Reyranella sp.]|uniref:hypothetical protein n=1 Tax=Reyranella sp. TaxID=1929291 RepID=UPI003D0E4F02
MTSATLAILVMVAVGTIAGLVIRLLLPPKLPLPPEQAINDSLIARQWAGDPGHPSPLPVDLPTHVGIDGSGSG